MKTWLSILSAAGLLLYPFATFGIDYGSQPSQTQQAPPVAQTLVREGDFAVKLAAEIKLGAPTDEAVAEDMLASAGVSPTSGWLSDYPVTPEIIGQLKDSIDKAAAEGKLTVTLEEATQGLYNLAAQMNLPTPAGQGSVEALPSGQSDPAAVNNYYYDEGPPIITYYPPPANYVYLYDWVPYPVFWYGFWFPGFYMCRNFTTTVVVTRPAFRDSDRVFVTRRGIVSNRFINPATGTVAVIDPVVRTSTGFVRPVTTLRTGDGRMFSSVENLGRGVALSGVSAMRADTLAGADSRKWGGFSSPEARRSAQSIFTSSAQAMNARREPESGIIARGESHSTSSGAPARTFRPPMMRNTGGSARSAAAPHSTARPSSAPSQSGGGAPMRWFNGIGRHGR